MCRPGTRYQGQFQHNLREGYGVLTAGTCRPLFVRTSCQFTDGSLYEGGWREDVPEAGHFCQCLETQHSSHYQHPPVRGTAV